MMSAYAKISELAGHVGEEVTVRGWLHNKRSSGKIAFLIVRDGTGLVQAVMSKADVTEPAWSQLDSLEYETSLAATGTVRPDKRAPGGYEMSLSGLEIVGSSSEDYPIQLKEHGVDFLLENRHLWLRTPRQVAIMRVRDEVIKAIRDFLYDRGFVNVDTPILTGAIGESAGTLFETEYFDLGKAYLAQTGQLYNEANAAALGRVYCFGPTFRAEKSKTRRHLTEFWMLEPEMAWCDSECNMKVQEELVAYIVARAVERCRDELEGPLERDVSRLATVQAPFPRLSYSDAIEKLQGADSEIAWGDDLGAEDETLVAQDYDRPVFIYNYPKQAKAFYMKENPDDPRTVLCNDMIAPEGYGEIIGGSQREDVHDKLLTRIREEGLPEEAYRWYLDLRRYGSFPHSGFGLGLERTVAWICGVHHVREVIAYPRTMNRIYP
ncbi:MAG TPA: asparagine--tRNA ligase [Gemmatimonadota bacterium]|nr:asparagine--tRNA ligase [Gemmatimonadota bacterium]